MLRSTCNKVEYSVRIGCNRGALENCRTEQKNLTIFDFIVVNLL